MKTIDILKILGFLFTVSFFAVSCDKSKDAPETSVVKVQEVQLHNDAIVQEFKKELKKNSTLKSSEGTLKKVSANGGKELFAKYFNDFQVEVNGRWMALKDCKEFSTDDLYHSVVDKLYKFENYNVLFSENQKLKAKKKPTREQIRAAMKKECDTYIAIASEICHLAVDIAYVLG